MYGFFYHFPRSAKLFILFILGMVITVFFGQVLLSNNSVLPPPPVTSSPNPTQEISPTNIPYNVEVITTKLSVPWSIVFTSPNRILVTERPGKIREVVNNQLNTKPLIIFPEIKSVQEEGLMGLEIDPDYTRNKYLYATLSYPKGKSYMDKVVRLIDNGNSIEVDKILLDEIPAAQVHAGSRIKFGPDKKLYVTTGDATDKENPQNLSSLSGKILRMNADGSIPIDNPFPNSYVYSYGHRNPQGLAWNMITGQMYATEHGPSGFDGPPGGDEVNHILPKGNYGWPTIHHELTQAEMINPLVLYTPAVAPASALIYSGKIFPQFRNNLFFGGLRGTGLYRIIFDDNNPDAILSQEKMSDINVGRVRDVIEGPDGYIYFTTSNTDGRGSPSNDDDKIYRLVP